MGTSSSSLTQHLQSALFVDQVICVVACLLVDSRSQSNAKYPSVVTPTQGRWVTDNNNSKSRSRSSWGF